MEFYSQCNEDKIIYELYFKNKKNPGIYIEAGALNGIDLSNTYAFSKIGWTGILIEPNPIAFEQLVKNRPNDKCYNDVISNIKEITFKFIKPKNKSINTLVCGTGGVIDTLPKHFEEKYYKNKKEREIIFTKKTKTLSEIIKDSGYEYIDFFSLDVEGHELNVLMSYDFSVPIKIILCESLSGCNEKNLQVRELLEKNNYKYDRNIGHNELYILQD